VTGRSAPREEWITLTRELIPDIIACLQLFLVQLQSHALQALLKLSGSARAQDGAGDCGLRKDQGQGDVRQVELSTYALCLL